MRIASRLGGPLALAVTLLVAAPAKATIPAEPAPAAASLSPEATRLGVEVARRIFGRVDWQTMLKRTGRIDSIGANFDQLKVRPQWGDFARQALSEEFADGAPEIGDALGHVFVRHFTLEELRAGAELLRGPVGDAIAQATADATAGREITPASAEAQAAIRVAARNPAGASFIQKMGHLGKVIPETDRTVGGAVALGWIHRFYDKAAAAERPRAAASDEKERLAGRLAQLMFQSVDFAALMQSKVGPEFERSFAYSPEWADLMRTSVTEEFGSGDDLLEQAGGKVFARYFTLEELRAGVAALSGPDGAVIAQAVASGAGGGAAPSPAALNHVSMSLARTPAGLAFVKKMEASGEAASTEMGEEYGAVAMLGVLRRFIEKAEATPPA